MTTLPTTRTVVVTGDVTIDWNIACSHPSRGRDSSWIRERHWTGAYWQRGGAALLADLVESIAKGLLENGHAQTIIRQTDAPKEQVIPQDPRFHHAYKQWHTFPEQIGASSGGQLAWRLQDWLGMSLSTLEPEQTQWAHVHDDDPRADLIVLGDANLGFRDKSVLWPLALTENDSSPTETPWILLKMSRPVAQGPLWQQLHRHFSERLIVVTTIDDLRQTEVQISRELSWERTAQDLAWELVYNPHINTLSHCAHVVVSFGTAGVLLLSRLERDDGSGAGSFKSHLFFDPKVIEGMWEVDYPGKMSGYTSCITASLAHQILVYNEDPNIAQAVQGGLASLRKLHQHGFAGKRSKAEGEAVIFPVQLIANDILSQPAPFSIAPVRDPGGALHRNTEERSASARQGLWTILEDRYTGGLDQVAQQIVFQGVDVALQDVPLGQFGALITVDRQEIESYRSLRTLVGEYCQQDNPGRPLSLGVFGAPGSGKSFGVSQVAGSLLPGQIEKLVFNLSQFDAPNQLLDAFHQVRDTALSGRIPLVFWDEFDTALDNQPLGWLRHFLAPMQDGVFQEGQILHPIGRSIFVFAGGTSESMESFDHGSDDIDFRAAKGPDFVSRLKGFVNVVGPNPQSGNPEADPYFIIRRAILLRFLLRNHAPQIFHRLDGVETPRIDSGVLRAFLEIPVYKHGARSLESIVTTSSLAGRGLFERSALPTEKQLSIHVDGRQFLSLVQQLILTGNLLEELAAAAYHIYRTSIDDTVEPKDVEQHLYATLSVEEKEQNRLIVRDIPAKLAYAGYIMRPARSDEPPFDFPDGDREKLAELEHERWLMARVSAGWRYAANTDQHKKTHAVLLPWRALPDAERRDRYGKFSQLLGHGELPEEEKEKNRALIDGIPLILAQAGYTLIKVGSNVS